MSTEIKTITKDVWTKVLTNVTYSGSVHIVNISADPTEYLVALVNTGDAPPVVGYEGGIVFTGSFAPSNSVASDYYVMAKNNDGKVIILT